MRARVYAGIITIAVSAFGAFAQPRPQERGWIHPHDENRNEVLEPAEISAAIERTFAGIDKNGNGVLETDEIANMPRPRRREMDGVRPPEGLDRSDDNHGRFLPPNFFAERLRGESNVSKERFGSIVGEFLNALDRNADGSITADEGRSAEPRHDEAPGGPSPRAQFLGAEMRFGDKPVRGQPFSAETVVTDTRLLFDGTTVKNVRTGAIHRDAAGRVRREQTLDTIAGTPILAAGGKAQKLVFITDFAASTQIFLDENLKTARRSKLNPRAEQPPDPPAEQESGSVVGTRTISGVTCELTRDEQEIPIGRIGNDKPLKVVSERCYSPQLQLVLSSSHRDPLAGLHEFTLRNIRRAEPASDLFAIPAGYRVEN